MFLLVHPVRFFIIFVPEFSLPGKKPTLGQFLSQHFRIILFNGENSCPSRCFFSLSLLFLVSVGSVAYHHNLKCSNAEVFQSVKWAAVVFFWNFKLVVLAGGRTPSPSFIDPIWKEKGTKGKTQALTLSPVHLQHLEKPPLITETLLNESWIPMFETVGTWVWNSNLKLGKIILIKWPELEVYLRAFLRVCSCMSIDQKVLFHSEHSYFGSVHEDWDAVESSGKDS